MTTSKYVKKTAPTVGQGQIDVNVQGQIQIEHMEHRVEQDLTQLGEFHTIVRPLFESVVRELIDQAAQAAQTADDAYHNRDLQAYTVQKAYAEAYMGAAQTAATKLAIQDYYDDQVEATFPIQAQTQNEPIEPIEPIGELALDTHDTREGTPTEQETQVRKVAGMVQH